MVVKWRWGVSRYTFQWDKCRWTVTFAWSNFCLTYCQSLVSMCSNPQPWGDQTWYDMAREDEERYAREVMMETYLHGRCGEGKMMEIYLYANNNIDNEPSWMKIKLNGKKKLRSDW